MKRLLERNSVNGNCATHIKQQGIFFKECNRGSQKGESLRGKVRQDYPSCTEQKHVKRKDLEGSAGGRQYLGTSNGEGLFRRLLQLYQTNGDAITTGFKFAAARRFSGTVVVIVLDAWSLPHLRNIASLSICLEHWEIPPERQTPLNPTSMHYCKEK